MKTEELIFIWLTVIALMCGGLLFTWMLLAAALK